MNKILIVHTSWYQDYIKEMIDVSSENLAEKFSLSFSCAPGAIELAALAKHKIINTDDQYVGILFLGIVIRGGTSHYELVTNETFRSVGELALDYPDIAFINNVICVENKEQLLERLVINTKNNSESLKKLINEKSS